MTDEIIFRAMDFVVPFAKGVEKSKRREKTMQTGRLKRMQRVKTDMVVRVGKGPVDEFLIKKISRINGQLFPVHVTYSR